MKERLHKLLAQAGIASRRESEKLILAGRIRVNGCVVVQLGTMADVQEDVVEVDGIRLRGLEAAEYYLLHKPRGVVTTVRDPQRRPTVMRLLRGVTARVYPVGRLDADSEGLLLLTNDGDLAHRLTHPRFGIEKEYEVELDRPMSGAELDRLRRGVESLGDRLKPRAVNYHHGGSGASVVLTEGKKREVRRMFEVIGLRVTRLSRVRFGPILLGDLPLGQFRPLTKEEIEQLTAATLA